MKQSFQFSFYLSVIIAIITTLVYSAITCWRFNFELIGTLTFFFVILLSVFLVVQYRMERFIFSQIRRIHKDVALIDKDEEIKSVDVSKLQDRVKRLTDSKLQEIESLKEREEYRREFLGNIAHELKTPLFTVQGYISTLLDGAMSDKSLRKKYLERADKAVDRLIYIIKDLDMISRFETGNLTLEMQRFDIVHLIQEVLDLLEYKADQKEITLMTDQKYFKPIWVYADEDKIKQVVTNLVINSIKYGKQDGTTEISVDVLDNKKIIIRVTDDGVGIGEKHLPRLFERFYRVDKSGSRMEGGSGLGLSIVKHIVERHQENIYVKSEKGKGSEFSFTLQLAD